MQTISSCVHCGAALPADAPQGVCPKCMLALGFAPSDPRLSQEPPPTEPLSAGGRFALPRPEELARLFPQLEILDLLGHGGMGAVYKARHRGLDRMVALKILPAELGRDAAFVQRFAREARALARLNHPNIITVHDIGQAGDLCYFVMEYVDGVNLRQLRQSGTLPPKEALALIPQICDALQYAHDEGVVHRDIKPENILVDRKGRVKIADFGLAKLLGARGEHTLTGSQQAMGTFHYMAPEQLAGAGSVDHRADIYSLGVVFYELLTGNLPVGRFAPPSKKVQVDVRLDEVVLRALEAEPERRFQRASDVKTQVESICGLPAHAMPPHVQRMYGYEYRSRTTFLGWPLVHIATGVDPATMKKRVAKGWFAMGDVAVGGFAMGGLACGIFAFGGCALGGITFGGLSLGLLLAIGGMAIGGFALGGGAVGIVAIGGGAVGIFAYGGGAYGVYALGQNVRDPVAVEFFSSWGRPTFKGFTLVSIFTPFLLTLLGVAIFVAIYLKCRWETSEEDSSLYERKPPPFEDRANSNGVGLAIALCLIFAVLAAPVLGAFAWWTYSARQAPKADFESAMPSFGHVTPETESALDRVAALPPFKTLEQKQDELGFYTGWEMTEEGATLYEDAVRAMNLTGEQVVQINAAMREVFEKFLELEKQHVTQVTNAQGRWITQIAAFPDEVAPLENEFWSRLDAVLSVEQQRLARSNLHIHPLEARPGARLHHLVAPGLFGYVEHGARIEIWPMGSWRHWRITTNNYTVEESGPQLPPSIRRFGIEVDRRAAPSSAQPE